MTQELDGISAFSAVVAVGPEDDPRVRGDLLLLNSYRALEAIVDHLAATGRRRPAIVLTAWNGVRPKEEVFLARCRRHGMQVDAGSVIDLRMVEYSGLAQAYREALEARFAGGVDVDAVVCGVDVGAMATIRFLEERGLQVPVDVAVIGANDSTEAALYRPALASVDRRPAEVAHCIEEMVFGRLERPQAPPVRRRIDMRFVWRESAGGENCESGVER
jgi:DNA-binding LacI/PurR family transcriptional regulator